jgi:acetyl esterase/lipase
MPKAFARIALLLLLCLILAPSILAQAPPPTPAPARSDPATATVVLKVPGMDRVRVRKDLVYSTVDGAALGADVYLPPDGTKAARPPVVILVAGGAENTKAWGIYTSLGRVLAASGLASVPFNHRLRYPRRQYEEGAADLSALIAYLRQNQTKLELDASRIAVAVFSGGGPMLAPMIRERPAEVRCLVNFYAFLDTEHVDVAQAGTTPEVVKKFSPRLQFEANPASLPPLFIARAGQDAIPGVNASIDRFVAVALERNAPITLVNHVSGAHGFDHINDDARTREILKMAIEFLRTHLQP